MEYDIIVFIKASGEELAMIDEKLKSICAGATDMQIFRKDNFVF